MSNSYLLFRDTSTISQTAREKVVHLAQRNTWEKSKKKKKKKKTSTTPASRIPLFAKRDTHAVEKVCSCFFSFLVLQGATSYTSSSLIPIYDFKIWFTLHFNIGLFSTIDINFQKSFTYFLHEGKKKREYINNTIDKFKNRYLQFPRYIIFAINIPDWVELISKSLL